MAQFEEHMLAYRRFHLHPAEDAERRDLEEASFVAWHTFKAAFRDQPLLTEDYILQQNEQTLIDNMSSWIDQSAPQGYNHGASTSNTRRESVADPGTCSERLKQLTSEPPNANVAASWPYIESVTYGSKRIAS